MRSYFTASSIWQIPIGRGHALLGDASPLVNALVSCWQLGGIGNARSGLPLSVTMSRSASALPDQINKNQRPDRVAVVSLYPSHKTAGNWLNAAAFTTPTNGQWGTAGRNQMHAPGVWQVDSVLNRKFAVAEHMAVNFRAEAFNLFNRAQYASPSSAWNTSSCGQITFSFNSTPTGVGTPRQIQFMLRMDF
jgi:hypothetical protein